MKTQLQKLSFALAIFRAEQDSYPATLAELSPKYINEVPKDLFNNSNLHYQVQGDGYLLYSVGPNGKDDGGKSSEDDKTDDIAIRMPAAAH